MGVWKTYRFDVSTSPSVAWKGPSNTYEFDVTANPNSTGHLRFWREIRNDPVIIVQDNETPIHIQVDNNSTEWTGIAAASNSSNVDIHIVAVGSAHHGQRTANFSSTQFVGGRVDNSSTNSYSGALKVLEQSIKSFAITNAPPAFKIRCKNNVASSGKFHVFVNFRQKA